MTGKGKNVQKKGIVNAQDESEKHNQAKRKRQDSGNDDDSRPLCKYGELCYQKNPQHLAKFRHPHREKANVEPSTEDQPVASNADESETFTKLESPLSNVIVESPKENILDSHQSEGEEELPPSPMSVSENMKQKYLFEMPEDFYCFWEFCKHLQEANPCEALRETLGLKLVGPYQLLDGSLKTETRKLSTYLNTWRFYYDPPEFQTVLVGDLSVGFHLGYFWDDPKEMPAFIGSNTESQGCTITPIADNIFAAICHLITEKLKKSDPFQKSKLTAFRSSLIDWATRHQILAQPVQSEKLKKRKKNVVAKSFYGCGLVVPYNKKTQVGYREIPETDGNLKKILKKIVDSENSTEQDKNFDSLQELVTNVQYANDEGDWGMGLELGWDLLAYGGEVFHATILHLLNVAYELLERPQFATILKAHLNNRRHLCSN
nr:EOG090X0BAY [Sida crystallina]